MRLQAPKGSSFFRLDDHTEFGVSVGLIVGRLPLRPRALGGSQFVPTFGFIGVVVGGNHFLVGHGDEDGVADGEVGPLQLRLGFIHHVDVEGDAFGFFVKIHHLTLDGDGINFVETAPIIMGVSEERCGRHLGVKSRGVLELFIPYLIDGSFDEGDIEFVSGVVEGAVILLGGMFRDSVLDGCIGIVRCDDFVRQSQLGGDDEGDALLRGERVISIDDTP